jgi:L-arabinose isomerase
MLTRDKIESYLSKARDKKANIGVFAVGHETYWDQFPGLEERLYEHINYFFDKLKKETNANIITYDKMSEDYKSSYEAGVFFSDKNLDLIFVLVATYTPSTFTVQTLNHIRNVPVVLLCLQPSPGLAYEDGTMWQQLENDNSTSFPEINNGIIRSGREAIDVVVGMLYEDKRAWKKIKTWVEVATVCHRLKHDHLGYMGHGYEGMLDMNSDPTMFDGHFGMHVEHISMEDLEAFVDNATDMEVEEKLNLINEMFEMPEPGSDTYIAKKVHPEDLLWPARVTVGMEKLIVSKELTGMAYYYRGLNDNKFERLHSGMIIGNSLLTSRGIAIAGELDIKNCVAMLITDRLGAGGSFAEYHPIDFNEDFILVGHDGPHHLDIANGKPILRNLTLLHGKRGSGPSVEYNVKVGPMTMFGLTQDFEGKFKFIIAEGESLPGPIPATGNTNTRGKFEPDVRTFLERWSLAGATHHFSLGVGNVGHKIELVAKYLNINCIVTTPIKKLW